MLELSAESNQSLYLLHAMYELVKTFTILTYPTYETDHNNLYRKLLLYRLMFIAFRTVTKNKHRT